MRSTHMQGAAAPGPVTPCRSDDAQTVASGLGTKGQGTAVSSDFASGTAERKLTAALEVRSFLLDPPPWAGGCLCRVAAPCPTCRAWRAAFEDVAARRAEAAAEALEDRRMRVLLAAQYPASYRHRRPVRALPRRLPFDLDALADAVALRLRGSA